MERLYIGGEYVESTSASTIEIENPATEEVIAEVQDASAEDVDRAVEAARRAQRDGLGANIYTSSHETAMRAATELQAGTVWINDPLKDNDAAPFGGFKHSGLGRELGSEGISAFTQANHVHIDFAQTPSPEWWFPYERPAIAVDESVPA